MSSASLQTARTLPKGEYQVSGGIGSIKVDDAIANAYILEGTARYGAFENVDLGLRLGMGWNGIDGKWQAYADRDVAIAVGLAVGGLEYTTTVTVGGVETKTKTNIIDVVVPVYVSYDLTTWLSVYAVPKAVFRYIGGSAGGDTNQLFGGSGGIRLGSASGFFVESTYMYGLDPKTSSFQWNVSYFYNL